MSRSETEATARPWEVDAFTAELARDKATPIRINGGAHLCTSVADVFAWRSTGDARQAYDDGQACANAELIVRSVNNAEKLAGALRLFCDVNPSTLHINEVCRRHDVARAALAAWEDALLK